MSLAMRANSWRERIVHLAGKPWTPWLVTGFITLLGAALRLYKLGEWSFWIDELYTINHALAHFSSPDLIVKNIPPARNWVPVSVILTAQVLNIWGVTEWSARLASALIGTLSMPILYIGTKKLFGTVVALLSILLLAVSPWHIFWSQNARFYTSMLLFYSLALIAFYFGMERNKPVYFILFYIFLYLGFSERLSSAFIFPVLITYCIALWVLKFEKPEGFNLKNLLLTGFPILAGGIIEAASRIANGESRFFADFNWFFLYRNDDPIRLLGNISYNIGIPLMVIALFSGLFLILRKSRAGLLMLINALVPLLLLLAVNPFIFTKDRYVFMMLFSWIMLAAVGIHELLTQVNGLHKWLAIGILMLLIADASSDNLLYYRVNHGNRGEWKTAFQIIKAQSEPDDLVVTYWPEFQPFYLDREFLHYEDITVSELLAHREQFWFVLDAETIWANPEVKSLLEKQGQLIDIRYLRTPDDFFLRIYRFDPEQARVDQ
jgi:mannosyltransferase